MMWNEHDQGNLLHYIFEPLFLDEKNLVSQLLKNEKKKNQRNNLHWMLSRKKKISDVVAK
mgnify:CR=1 FL=1